MYMDKIILSILISRLNSPSCLSLSSQETCPRFPSSLLTFVGYSPACPCISCTVDPRTGRGTPGVALPVLSRGEGSFPSTCCNTPLNRAQSTVSLWCKHSLLDHVQFGVHQDHQGLFCKAFATGFVEEFDLLALALSVFKQFHMPTLRVFFFGVNQQMFSNFFCRSCFSDLSLPFTRLSSWSTSLLY